MELHAGHHVVVQLLGLNVNLDTLMMTWLVAALVIIVTVSATRGRSLVPSGLQNAMEWSSNPSSISSGKRWDRNTAKSYRSY